MKKNLRKLLLPLLFAVLGVVLGLIAVRTVQKYESRHDFEKTSEDFFSAAENTLIERENVLKELGTFNDRISARVVYNLSFLIDYDNVEKKGTKAEELQQDFVNMAENCGMDELYLTTMDGKVLLAGDQGLCGKNLSDEGLFGKENWAALTAEGSWEDESLGVNVQRDGEELRYYAIGVSDTSGANEYLLIGGEKTDMSKTIREYLTDLSLCFNNITGYDEIAAFAVNADTGMVVYASKDLNGLVNKNISEIIKEDSNAIADGNVRHIRFDGGDRLIRIKRYESESMGNWLYGTISIEETPAIINFYQWAALIIFVTVIFAYISIQSQQNTGRKKMLHKSLMITPVALLGTFVLLYYIYSMSSTSMAMEQMKVNSETFAESYWSNRSLTSAVADFYKDRYVDILQSSAEYLEENGDFPTAANLATEVNTYSTRDEKGNVTAVTDAYGNPLKSYSENHLLQIMTEEMGQECLMLFNSSGRTISTSNRNWYFEIKNCEEEFRDGLFEVLDRKKEYYYQIEGDELEDAQGEMISCFAVPISLYTTKAENGNTVYLSRSQYEEHRMAGDKNLKKEVGLLYSEVKTPKLIYLSDTAVAEDTLNQISPAQNSSLALIWMEDGSLICSTDGISEKSAAALGFDLDDCKKESYRFTNSNGVYVFAGLVPTGEKNEYTVLTVFPGDDVFLGRIPVCLAGMLSVLAVLILMILHLRKYAGTEDLSEEQEKKLILPQNARGYRSITEYLERLNSEERIAGFFRAIFLVITFVLLLRLANNTEVNSSCLAFHYTIGKTWKRELSLFSISYAFNIFIVAITLLTVLQKLVNYFVPILGKTSETVVRLILSLTEYICALVLIFYNLYLFGVQMGTVLTSAGIMTIVVGLGANSLISDVLAGLFIIMEQEYKPGDIVTIDGFTGFVRNIGLRTTKVQDFSGNIKTFSNAKINGVLNLTDNYTTFFVTMSIHVDTPVEQIEDLVEKDLKKRLENNPDLVTGPWFSGIPEINGNTYSISIGASSLQQKAWSLRKQIIQEMLILLKEKGIKIS